MNIGNLDQRISLLQLVEGVDEFGAPTEEWQEQATVWAHVISQRGGEAFEAARVQANRTLRIQLRYRADVDETWRVEWMGEQYNITAVDRSERRDGSLWLTAELVTENT